MGTNDIIIKSKRINSALYALASVVFLFASIYCVILPATDIIVGNFALYIKIAYLVIGCIGIMFFGYKVTFHVIKLISPPISIIITEEGIVDYTVPDGGIAFVAWDNIAETKLFGEKKCDWLGVSLRSTKKVFMGLSKSARSEIRDNIDAGMPAIIIKSSDISIDIYELRSIIQERLELLNDSTRTKVMQNKPSVSQVYGSAQNKAVYQDDEFITDPRLADDDDDDYDEYDINATTTSSDAITDEPSDDKVVDEPKEDVKIAKAEEPIEETPAPAESAEVEAETIVFDKKAVIEEAEKKENASTSEFDVKEPKFKTSSDRFFEQSAKRPLKKSEIVTHDDENIDDILSALSAKSKKKENK